MAEARIPEGDADRPATRADVLEAIREMQALARTNQWRRRGERILPWILILGVILALASVGVGTLAYVAASRAGDAADATRRQGEANSVAFSCIRAWAEVTNERSIILTDARQDYDDAAKQVFLDAFNPGDRTKAQQRALLIQDGLRLTTAATKYDQAKAAHPIPPTPQFTC